MQKVTEIAAPEGLTAKPIPHPTSLWHISPLAAGGGAEGTSRGHRLRISLERLQEKHHMDESNWI